MQIVPESAVDYGCKTPKALANLQPRVARVKRATLGDQKEFHRNPEGVVKTSQGAPIFANSFRVHSREIHAVTQGVAPGSNLLTPSAFTRMPSQSLVLGLAR